MSAPTLAACMNQIRRFAGRVHRRLQSGGVRGYEVDDVVQECSIAYVIAADKWNPESGVPFAPYLARGMQHHVNRWAKLETGESHGANMSLDLEYDDADGARTLHDAIGASQDSAEDVLALKMRREKVLKVMSPRTRLFAELFESPPDYVVEAWKGQIAKAENARDRGLFGAAPKSVQAGLIFDFMDADAAERREIRRELLMLSQKVNRS